MQKRNRKYKYPIITVENFEQMTKRLVGKGRFWNKNWKTYDTGFVLKVRTPKNRNDFFNMTKNMYGIGFEFIGRPYSYEIVGNQSSYSQFPVAKLWDKKYGQYDGLKIFLNTAFGLLSCGGVAGAHYGQYKLRGHGYRAKKRIEKLYDSKLSTSLSKSANHAHG